MSEYKMAEFLLEIIKSTFNTLFIRYVYVFTTNCHYTFNTNSDNRTFTNKICILTI